MNKNIIVNFIGRFWLILSNIVFLPLYIQILGFDNYAVISFSLIIIGILLILDVGLSASIAREVSRADIANDEKFKTFRTLEKIYILIFFICASVGLLFSKSIAVNFINSTPIDRDLISFCLKVIACEAGMQIIFRFYVSTLMGLEKQIRANAFNIAWGALRNGFTIIVILVSPTLESFFLWQLISTVLLAALIKWDVEKQLVLWKPKETIFFDMHSLRRIRHFAIGIFLVSVVAAINSQIDKLAISRLLDLETLGYYNIAVSIGASILAMSSPLIAAIQPRMTNLFSNGRIDEARSLYIQVATIAAILVFPLMAVVGINAEVVVITWTGDLTVAAGSAAIIPWLTGAYAMLAMSSIAYSIALANGYTRYNNIIGFMTLFVSIPGYWLIVGRFGAVGASALFMTIQVCVSFSFHILIDKKFLNLGVLRSFLQLYLLPAFIAIVTTLVIKREFVISHDSRVLMFFYLGSAYLSTLCVTGSLITLIFRLKWTAARRRRQI